MRHETTSNSTEEKAQIFGFTLLRHRLLCASACPAQAQQPKKVPRVGYLSNGDPATESTRSEGIRLALRERGHIEGQNIAIEYRYTEGKRDRLPELLAELVRLKVDIILVSGGHTGPGGEECDQDDSHRYAGHRVRSCRGRAHVESLARPGGNVTGVTILSRELGGKRLELLKEAVPKVARVAVFYDPALPPSVIEVKEVLPVAARALRLTLQPWEVRRCGRFRQGFCCDGQGAPGWTPACSGGPLMAANRKRIADFALKSRLPSMHGSREAVDVGGLMSYGADQADSYRRVAYFVDKILKGAKPADLPVEQPTKFEFIINLKAAKQIGLTIPPANVLVRADRVIK